MIFLRELKSMLDTTQKKIKKECCRPLMINFLIHKQERNRARENWCMKLVSHDKSKRGSIMNFIHTHDLLSHWKWNKGARLASQKKTS